MIILTLIHHYLPGYKSGGPVQTLASMVDKLSDEFNFKVITTDRDKRDKIPYPDIQRDKWSSVGKGEVFYCSSHILTLSMLHKIICKTPHDILYLNSFFSPAFTVMPLLFRWLGLIPRKPVVIAPRGEFSPGAFQLKGRKKKTFLRFAKSLGLYDDVTWHASSSIEESDIRRYFGQEAYVFVAPNLSSAIGKRFDFINRKVKEPGHLDIVFLSRISPKKNLHGALSILRACKGSIQFHIYGPIDDSSYWTNCQNIMNSLPPNIHVEYRGPISHEQVATVMAEYNLFFLPTFGENFGHVILEALLTGCPVLISDQTPWRNVERKGVGWDIPLAHPERFQTVLQQCIEMDNKTFQMWSQRAREYGLRYIKNESALEKNRELFYVALRKGAKTCAE